ncbi:MAG: transcriptional regulator [Pseudonocardiales bacterium]|nr:MAG: transcriptional regulator [Pseudonocardiales bacterium]
MSRESRTYDDPCGIARALDRIGERWGLLIVRELLLGPKRFTQLRRGLAGASPNVISQRLKQLEENGIVRRTMLDPPASVAVYELTPRGRDLEPVLLELGRWGSRAQVTAHCELSVDALMIALMTTFDPARARGVDAEYAVVLDGERFRVGVRDGRLEVVRGRCERPVASLESDVTTLRELVFGARSLAEAIGSGSMRVAGDRRAASRFLKLYAVPQPA